MTSGNCGCKRDCVLIAVVAALLLGVVAAFLQITGVITVAPAFLWAAVGLAAVYLSVLLVTTQYRYEGRGCACRAVRTVLAGILGTVLLGVILLAVGIVATSVVSAILVGILTAFLTLIFAGTACLILCQTDCDI